MLLPVGFMLMETFQLSDFARVLSFFVKHPPEKLQPMVIPHQIEAH
jgi:hypothetical protein